MSKPSYEDRKRAVQEQERAIEKRNRDAGMSERTAREKAQEAMRRVVNERERNDWK